MSEAPDLSALPLIPRDESGPVFKAPWEAQAFAMTVKLHAAGHFTWTEWATALSEEIKRAQAAGDADLGIAAGNKRGYLFVKGRNVAVVPEDEMVPSLVEWAEFITEHGVDAALERVDTDKAAREAERDRALLLEQQGDDVNASEQRVELMRRGRS